MLRSTMAGVDAMIAQSKYTFPKHTHDQFGIGVVEQGAHRSLSGRGYVEASPGDVITVNPNEVHDGSPVGDRGRSWRILYFDPPIIADAVADIGEGRLTPFELADPVIRDVRLARRLRSFFSTVTGCPGESAGFEARQELLLLLGSVLRRQGNLSSSKNAPAAIQHALQQIEDAPAAAIKLAELARICGLSQFQLIRSFSRVTGLTPHAYLVQCRIKLARQLIAKGTSLAEAAIMSGFADQSHMTRVFTRTYGISPRRYADAVA